MDDEQPPGMTPMPSTSDGADGMGNEEVAAEEPPQVQVGCEDPPTPAKQREEEQVDERTVSPGMEAEAEEIAGRDVETAELGDLALLSSDFAVDEDEKEADTPGSHLAVDGDVMANVNMAIEDDVEEEAAFTMLLEEKELEVSASVARSRGVGRKKRGRPPKSQASRLPTKKKEEEDLCFICFDGGNLVVCDRRGCPKVYHPSCVNRDESFFRSKGRWNCGWHICSICEKAANFMCLTCTYSLCKSCIKRSEFVCVRGNKGFCETCRSTVMLIETDEQEKKKVAGVDFDDRNSWMYLFKDYWLDMKKKLSLTLEEISKAKNPWKGPLSQNESSDDLYDAKEDLGSSSDSSSVRREGRKPARKKAMRRSKATAVEDEPMILKNNEVIPFPEDSEWASEELLEFVAHMRGGDKAVMCQFDVHKLLLDYIRWNNLRDPRRKSQIICDSRLEKLFGKTRVGHFEMLKLLESHFLLKETSQVVTDDNQGGVVDPEFSQMDTEGSSEVVLKTSSEKKRKSRKRIEEREPQNNLDDYAAIDIHNIGLIYLRRNLTEELLDDADNFNEKVVGTFVRIRISSAGQRQDMYRLVQVIGTDKVAEKYKTGKRTTDITLEIINLSKTEVISIDSISNQDFTEEECDRLRQSIKCGLISRLTVRNVLEKAMTLLAVRVNESLENEKLRLSHLRDRASEKGRRKELRECVEKLQLLNSPEEHSRRLNDVPVVHTDPKMDPNYESAEEELDEKKHDSFSRSSDTKFARRGRELNYSLKGNFTSTDSWSGPRRGSTASWDSGKSLSTSGTWDKVETPKSSDRVNEMPSNRKDLYPPISWDMPKSPGTAMVKDTGYNVQAGIRPEQFETKSATQCTETVVQLNVNENEKTWHYKDPSGKIQGPFSMTQLRKWSTTGYFPANLKIWRMSDKQEDSILLTDALAGKFQRELPPLEMQQSTLDHLPKVSEVVDDREGNIKGNSRASNDSWVEKKKDVGGLSCIQSNLSGNMNSSLANAVVLSSQSSGQSFYGTGTVQPEDGKVGGSSPWGPSKDPNAWSSQHQAHAVPSFMAAQFPVNPNQLSPHQGRGRVDNAGRWKEGPNQSHGNSWSSNRAAVHPSTHGYGRPQSTSHVYPRHQSPMEPWKTQSAGHANQWGNDPMNLPTPTPRPGGSWISGQGIGNQSSATAVSVLPAAAGWAGTATQGGNIAQFSSVAVNEANKGVAWVGQPSSAYSLPSWGSNPSSNQTETPTVQDSSATATVDVVKGSALLDCLVTTAQEPNVQNAPLVLDKQPNLSNEFSSKAPFENEMLNPGSGKDDDISRVASSIFLKNVHMKDDCPSPTPKDEQAKFDALISESGQHNHGENLDDHQSSHLVLNTSSAPGIEVSSTKLAIGADDLESPCSEKQTANPSNSKDISEPHVKPSEFSFRQETTGFDPTVKEDELEHGKHHAASFHVETANSGNLGFSAGRSEWSMPSPTPVVQPSVSNGGGEPSLVNPVSSAQWHTNMPIGHVPSIGGQGIGYGGMQHVCVGTSQENMNRGSEAGQESGHINLGAMVQGSNAGLGPVIQGTTNAGLGTVVPANATGVWTNAPQGNANINLGWCQPPQGNANMNMFWLALAQANNGWANAVQANPNTAPGWVLTAPTNTPTVPSWGAVMPQANPMTNQSWIPPVQASANPSSGWATPQNNGNQNAGWNVAPAPGASSVGNPAGWGTQQKCYDYPGHDDRGFQNNDGGHGGPRHGRSRPQSTGGGGSSRAPPRGPRAGICLFHENGHCKKGANCNYLHTS